MRASALKSIRPVLEQAIDAINDSFERGNQSQKTAAEFDKEYERLLALSKGHKPTIELEQSSTKQHKLVLLSSPMIEGFYPWRHRVVLAADSLAECGWTIEARSIHEELNRLPKHQVDWAQPGARDDLRDAIQKSGARIRDCLACCVTEIQASIIASGSVLTSSKPENPTKTDNNFNAAHAREQLQPYVKNPAFRQYLKEQITQWELWHRSHTEEINEHEGLRDKFHQELKELQGRDFRHSDDPADFDPLGHAETCYENYRDIAAGLKDDPEYKLVADREPVLFKETSVASIVALFWCDVNDSTWLVPEYDFLEPEGPFIEYLREQWEKPIQGRYKHIDWFVEASIEVYESRIAKNGEPKKDAPLKPITKAKFERNDWLLKMRGMDHRPKMTESELSDALLKECENKPNWVHLEPKSISVALREAYTRQTGNPWPFDGRGRNKKTGKYNTRNTRKR